MVVHPAPGHAQGTLVNALLHHCNLPAMQLSPGHAPITSLASFRGGHIHTDTDHSIAIGTTGICNEEFELLWTLVFPWLTSCCGVRVSEPFTLFLTLQIIEDMFVSSEKASKHRPMLYPVVQWGVN